MRKVKRKSDKLKLRGLAASPWGLMFIIATSCNPSIEDILSVSYAKRRR